MKPFASIVLALWICAGLSANQIPNPDYDAELAKRLRADEYGMASYVFGLIKKGPRYSEEIADRETIFRGHLDNIGRMAEDGSLLLAGPFGAHDLIRGIYIFDVESIAEAESLAATDPAVQAGLLEVELVEWYGSAGLRGLYDIHKKLGQTSP